MKDFFHSMEIYCKNAGFATWYFWVWPLLAILLIWLLTIGGANFFKAKRPFLSVYSIFRGWLISSLVVATIIISFTCYQWTEGFFYNHHFELALLLSLVVAFTFATISFYKLSQHYTQHRLKEIITIPLTRSKETQLLMIARKGLRNLRFLFLFPVIGFLFLLLVFNLPNNLIHIVYDNSSSMKSTNAMNALKSIFQDLPDNNKVIFTTLEIEGGHAAEQHSIDAIMSAKNSESLKAGHIAVFDTPKDAKNSLSQTLTSAEGSPICEAIYKTYLFSSELKSSVDANNVLIIITDGQDDIGATLKNGKFLYDDNDYSTRFPPERTFVISYLPGGTNAFLDRFQKAGANVTPANSEDDFIDALNAALGSFRQDWNLIYWSILIYVLCGIAMLIINPSKTI